MPPWAGRADTAAGLFNLMPNMASTSLLGTNKLASACGTTFAARSFVGKVTHPLAAGAAGRGQRLRHVLPRRGRRSYVPQQVVRPMVLVLIIIMAIYTFIKKDFGRRAKRAPSARANASSPSPSAAPSAFMTACSGRARAAFLIFLFIRVFGFDFILASACSKLVNIATNVAALAFSFPPATWCTRWPHRWPCAISWAR